MSVRGAMKRKSHTFHITIYFRHGHSHKRPLSTSTPIAVYARAQQKHIFVYTLNSPSAYKTMYIFTLTNTRLFFRSCGGHLNLHQIYLLFLAASCYHFYSVIYYHISKKKKLFVMLRLCVLALK